ncbi:MAG: transposase [Candidatus Thiosymbion ectosymbiont of Robbea hypermnestra]|nr:transposase [Candidatus Thiosymbion ectosymbiont of Robbea hypermnestra]
MGRDRYRIHDQDAPYFLTCTVLQWLPLFAHPANVQILLESLRFLQSQDRLILYGYVILENHCHLLAAGADLAKAIASFKSFTARRIVKRLRERHSPVLELLAFHKARHKVDREHQVWQEGSHPEQIQGEAMMRQKLEYIHNNPVARGYVDNPVHWRYSSARNYARQEGLIEVVTQW